MHIENSQNYGAPRTEIAGDILSGADEIAHFLFGRRDQRRRVYYLSETHSLPTFRLGTTICARRTTLLAWIEAQEQGRAA